MVGGLSGRYINGIGKIGERMIVILNILKILTADEFSKLSEIRDAESDEKNEDTEKIMEENEPENYSGTNVSPELLEKEVVLA